MTNGHLNVVRRLLGSIGIASILLLVGFADPKQTAPLLPVRHAEGVVHGFLALRTTDGVRIADGDLIQNAHGDQVTTQLVFRFKDGSVHDERTTFSQRARFQLLAYHLNQRGPSFPQPLSVDLKRSTRQVIVKSADDHGEPKNYDESLELPGNLANGLVPVLLKNAKPDDMPMKLSMLAATPKPRLVTLDITFAGGNALRGQG
jgi:hypothetical protein